MIAGIPQYGRDRAAALILLRRRELKDENQTFDVKNLQCGDYAPPTAQGARPGTADAGGLMRREVCVRRPARSCAAM